MKNVAILAFRIGQSTPNIINASFLDFYRWVSQVIIREDCKIIDGESHTTIAIDNVTLSQTPYDIYKKFHESKKEWQNIADVLIVDLANPEYGVLRGPALIHLSQAIDAYYKEADSSLKIIILLSDLPPREDPFRIYLNSHIESKKVVLIGNGKVNREFSSELKDYRESEYQIRLMKIRENPLDLLKFKMIRRFGHFLKFDRTGNHSRCIRYYYDGILCKNELTQLFTTYFELKYPKKSDPIIYYYAPISPWLSDAVLVWTEELGLRCINIEKINGCNIDLEKEVSRPLLIVPSFYSGESLIEAIELIFGSKSANLHVLAVMTSDSNDDKERIRYLQTINEKIRVEYLLEVKNYFFPKGKCPLCEIGIPNSKPNIDTYAMLTSYDMWDMVERAGWKEEEDVPHYRPALEVVPDFPKFVEQNGAWLSTKLRLIMNSMPHGFPTAPVIVCPDEIGSRVFSNFLKAILNLDVIRIPKVIINKFIDPIESEIEEIISRNDLWCQQLKTSTVPSLILIDEFNMSGKTRLGMINMLEHFKKKTLCYFSIVDFFGSEKNPIGLQCLSFYSFEIK